MGDHQNSSLSKYYTNNPITAPRFAFAERDNEWEYEDVIPNSFINRVPEWLRVAKLPYEQLQSTYLKRHGEDAAYKSFSEVFSWLIEERSVQSSTSSNIQNQQKNGPPTKETIDLNALSSSNEGPVINAETRDVDSVGNSEHQATDPSGYYCSV